jgi:hypothetical protein
MSVLVFARPNKPSAVPQPLQSELLSQAQLNTFGDSLTMVTAFCNAANAASLLPPLPGHVPTWYPTLNQNLTNLKGHSLNWIGNIGPSMTAIPQAIINYKNSFDGQYNTIIALLDAIGINPPTPTQKANLIIEMNALLNALKAQQQVLTDAQSRLVGFNSDISGDYTALNGGAASITEAITEDKSQVVSLGQQIKALQIEVDAMHQEMIYVGLGVASGAVVGVIGLAFSQTGLGIFVAIIGFAGMLASVGVMIAAGVRMAQAKDNITADMEALNIDNQQIVVLNSVSNTINMLVEKGGKATQAMAAVLIDWATLVTKMESVIEGLNAAEHDIGSILDLGDMATAKLAWDELADYAQGLQNVLGNVIVLTDVNAPRTGTNG